MSLAHRKAVAMVTVGLVATGAVLGAVSGALALLAVFITFGSIAVPLEAFLMAAGFGAAFGASAAPALAWTMLRTVPIGRASMWLAISGGVGGAVGFRIGIVAANPYAPFTLLASPMPQALGGALACCLLVAGVLRARARQKGAG